jgi:hypothetical protein
VRLDDPAGNQAIVSVNHCEGTGANELRELADRRQTRACGELSVLDELRDALGDLVDERDGGFARELKHMRLAYVCDGPSERANARVASEPRYVTMMIPVMASATAIAALNPRRLAGRSRKRRSELPKRAHTAIHGMFMTTMMKSM